MNKKTVVRGGFGIYYSQIVDNNAANYALSGITGVFNYTAGPRLPFQHFRCAAAGLSAGSRGAGAQPLREARRGGELVKKTC